MDPYERANITSDQYYDWLVKNAYLAAYGVMKTAAFRETCVEYPPSQPPASFSVDQIVEDVKKRIERFSFLVGVDVYALTPVVTGGEMSDEQLQALWLRRVQTKPSDFLRAKFAYQLSRRHQEKPPP